MTFEDDSLGNLSQETIDLGCDKRKAKSLLETRDTEARKKEGGFTSAKRAKIIHSVDEGKVEAPELLETIDFLSDTANNQKVKGENRGFRKTFPPLTLALVGKTRVWKQTR